MLLFMWYDNITIPVLVAFQNIFSVDPSLWSGHGAQQVQGQALHPCSGEEEENPGVRVGGWYIIQTISNITIIVLDAEILVDRKETNV